MVLPGLRSLKSLLGSSNKRGNSGRKHKEKGGDADGESVGLVNSLRVVAVGDPVTDQKDKGSCKVTGYHQVHPENHTIDHMMEIDGIGALDSTSIVDNRKHDSIVVVTNASPNRGSCGGGRNNKPSSRIGSKVTAEGLPSLLVTTSLQPIVSHHDENEIQPQKKSISQNRRNPVVVMEEEEEEEEGGEKSDGNLVTYVRGGDRANNCLTSWDSSSSSDFRKCDVYSEDKCRDSELECGESSEKHDPVKECLERRVKELEKLLEVERQRVGSLTNERTAERQRGNDPRHREHIEQIKNSVTEDEWKAECDAYKAQVACLEDELRKKDQVMQNILKFQSKLRQISREKSSIQLLHERKLRNCQLNIVRLEKLNKLLIGEIKNLESVASAVGCLASCRYLSEGRSSEEVPLDRMKYLEAENSSLVVENEQQRMQYEKCLDDVANQVVQALLVQKSLQGECSNLRKHVADLEQQNQTLRLLFRQQLQRTCDRKIQFGGSFTLPDTRISNGFHYLPQTSSHLSTNEGFCCPNLSRCKRDRSTSPSIGDEDRSTAESFSNRPSDMSSSRGKDKFCKSSKISLSGGLSSRRRHFMSNSSSHWRQQSPFSNKNDGCWIDYCNTCVAGGDGGDCCCLLPPNGSCHGGCCYCDDNYCRVRNGIMVTRSLPRNGRFRYRSKQRPASHSLVMGMADLLRLNGLKNRAHFKDDDDATAVFGSNARCNCMFEPTSSSPLSMRAFEPLPSPPPPFVSGCPTRFTMVDHRHHHRDTARVELEAKSNCYDEKSSIFCSNISANCPLELDFELINARCRPCGDFLTTSSCCELHSKVDARQSLMKETAIQPKVLHPPVFGWNEKCNCSNPVVCHLHQDEWHEYNKSSLQKGPRVDVTKVDRTVSDLLSNESVERSSGVDGTSESAVIGDVVQNENNVSSVCEVSLTKNSSSVLEDSLESEERSTANLVSRDEGYSTMSSDVQCDAEIGDRSSKRASMNNSPEFFKFKLCEGEQRASNQMHLAALEESQECSDTTMASKEVEKRENSISIDGNKSDEVNGTASEFDLDAESFVEVANKCRSSGSCLLGCNFLDSVSKNGMASLSPPTDEDTFRRTNSERFRSHEGELRRTKSEGDVSLLERHLRQFGCERRRGDSCGSACDVAEGSPSALRRSKGCLSLTEDADCDVGRQFDTVGPTVDTKTFASLPDDDEDDWFMVENLDCVQDACSTPEQQVVAAVNCYSEEEICNWSLNFSSDDVSGSPKKKEDSGNGWSSVKRLTNRSLFWSRPSSFGSLPSIQEVDVEWDFFSSLPSKARLVRLRLLRDGECRRLCRKIRSRRRDGVCKSWPCETDDDLCLRPKELVSPLGGWDSSASYATTSKGMSMSSITDEEHFGGNSENVLPAVLTPSRFGDDVKSPVCPPRLPQLYSEEGDRSPVETHFKSDFYMLCKVESCRSLDVSCKNLVATSDSGSYDRRSSPLSADFLQAVAMRRGKRSNGDGSFLLKSIGRSNERPIVLVDGVDLCTKPVCGKEGNESVARNLVKKTLHELSVMLSNIEYDGYVDEEGKEKMTDRVGERSISGRNSEEEEEAVEDSVCVRDNDQLTESSAVKEGLTTSWVHFETDVDLSDPKARANLLDSMLASSNSSSEADNSSSLSSEEDDEEEEEEEEGDIEVSTLVGGGGGKGGECSTGRPANCKYQQLHEIHRIRRFKRAATDRDQCVVRYIPSPRPSILDRKDFFYRYGEKEQEAVASFDFLESMSTSISDVGSLETLNGGSRGSPRRCSRDSESNTHKIGRGVTSGYDYEEDDNRNHRREPIQVTGGEGFSEGRTRGGVGNAIAASLYRDYSSDRMNLSVLTLTSQEDVDATERLSLSDSCAESFSCSSSSLNLDV